MEQIIEKESKELAFKKLANWIITALLVIFILWLLFNYVVVVNKFLISFFISVSLLYFNVREHFKIEVKEKEIEELRARQRKDTGVTKLDAYSKLIVVNGSREVILGRLNRMCIEYAVRVFEGFPTAYFKVIAKDDTAVMEMAFNIITHRESHRVMLKLDRLKNSMETSDDPVFSDITYAEISDSTNTRTVINAVFTIHKHTYAKAVQELVKKGVLKHVVNG